MGRHEKKLPDELVSVVKEAIEKNTNRYQITLLLRNSTYNFKCSYKILEREIENKLGMVWDKDKGRWVPADKAKVTSDIEDYSSTSHGNKEQQISFFGDEDKEIPPGKERQNTNEKKSQRTDQLTKIYNNVTALVDKMNELDKKVSSLQKSVERVKKEYPDIKEISQKFMEYFTSKSERTYLNLNTALREDVIKSVSKNFNIKRSNKAKIMDTALLLALYSMESNKEK